MCRSIKKNKKTHSGKDKSTGSYKSRDSLQTLRRTYHESDAELAQGEPYGGVGRGGLASQLAWLQAFWLFCMWRLWIKGQSKVSQQIQESDPEDEGDDGVPCQGHHGEGLHKLQVQDRGCLYSWRQFYWISWFSITTLYLSLGLHRGRPSYKRSLQLSKENIQHFKTWFYIFFPLFWVIFALLDSDPDSEYESGSGSTDQIESGSNSVPDRNPAPQVYHRPLARRCLPIQKNPEYFPATHTRELSSVHGSLVFLTPDNIETLWTLNTCLNIHKFGFQKIVFIFQQETDGGTAELQPSSVGRRNHQPNSSQVSTVYVLFPTLLQRNSILWVNQSHTHCIKGVCRYWYSSIS